MTGFSLLSEVVISRLSLLWWLCCRIRGLCNGAAFLSYQPNRHFAGAEAKRKIWTIRNGEFQDADSEDQAQKGRLPRSYFGPVHVPIIHLVISLPERPSHTVMKPKVA